MYNQSQQAGQYVYTVDPFVVQTLTSIVGSHVVVETVRGSMRGVLVDVKPDHIVLKVHDSSFFIRIANIVWVMPETT